MDVTLIPAAVHFIRTHFGKSLTGGAQSAADWAEKAVVEVVERLAQGDQPTATAMTALRQNPADESAATALQSRLKECVDILPQLRQDLTNAVQHASVAAYASGPGSVAVSQGHGGQAIVANAPGAVATYTDRSRSTVVNKTVNRHPVRNTILIVLALMIGIGIYTVAKGNDSSYDTVTELTVDNWHYKVSAAHLHMVGQLDGAAATPPAKWVYFDITVENLVTDRQAPGISFHFARQASTLSANCGEQDTMLMRSFEYVAGVVPGWCVSEDSNILDGGTNCYETNDKTFKGIDRIPAGGKNQVRCVDPFYGSDQLDLSTLRVYFVGSTVPGFGNNPTYSNVVQLSTVV